MHAVQFDENTARRHGPLVQRLAGITGSLGATQTVQVRDAADRSPAPPRSRVVLLARGADCGIERSAGNAIAVTYRDPTSETALALLLAATTTPGDPVAADPASLSVLALAERLAASDIPVLINGPTGTGKEVLSRFIHARSSRRDDPFIAVNCAAMPETMLEAMLFGHRKGAFTGASHESEGFMRAADGGTLLLDEIAELPLSLQAKLLRALQEQEVVPIGSTEPIRVDIRVIACANRDLPTEVSEGRFRADLFYRLNVFPLALPALRERPDDIVPLAAALALRHAPTTARTPALTDAAAAMLRLHSWPGNVRELENVIRRALLLADGAAGIAAEHIVFDAPARMVAAEPVVAAITPAAGKLSHIARHSEARAIVETLEACGGSRIAAARELGISERTLRYRLAAMRESGISVGRSLVAGGAR